MSSFRRLSPKQGLVVVFLRLFLFSSRLAPSQLVSPKNQVSCDGKRLRNPNPECWDPSLT